MVVGNVDALQDVLEHINPRFTTQNLVKIPLAWMRQGIFTHLTAHSVK